MKLGSLFDGSGGFPLAGSLCGIEPVWAAEVEPYPIAVTSSRFHNVKHLGSVTGINGEKIEPVDIITFGSPCQDLSVAGKRAGLKHEANGDEETTRSGLFMEAVRIIKEMREATNGRHPTFAVWENVPGAFSSNQGEDFRIVLEELIKVVEPRAVMPAVPKGGWAYADYYRGDGWSLSYRVLDAQYWGVPQRRRRVYLVADFGGERARKILFEREGLRGYFAESGTPWQAAAEYAEGSAGADDREGNGVAYGFPIGFRPENVRVYEEVGTTLCNGTRPGFTTGVVVARPEEDDREGEVGLDCYNQSLTGDKAKALTNAATDSDHIPCVVYGVTPASFYPQMKAESQCFRVDGVANTIVNGTNPGFHNGIVQPVEAKTWDCRGNGDGENVSTITGDHERRVSDYSSVVAEGRPIAIDRAFFNQGQNALYDPQDYEDGTVHTLVARGPSAVAMRYIVRRLTPTECARLQGFADRWGDIEEKTDFTDKEYTFWLDVRNTHAAINGKATKEYTKAQMLTWYNKLHTDSAEYKMWGNGIALPCARYVMEGIAEVARGELMA